MKIHTFIFVDPNQPNVEVTCREIIYRNGFYECINNGGELIAFYRADLLKGMDSKKA